MENHPTALNSVKYSCLTRYYHTLGSCHMPLAIAAMLLFCIILKIAAFISGIDIDVIPESPELSPIAVIMVSVVAAPIVETLIFQSLIPGFTFNISKKKILAILVSATIFALVHPFGIICFGINFLKCAFLTSVYLARKRFRGETDAFIAVVLTHGVWNGIIAVFEYANVLG